MKIRSRIFLLALAGMLAIEPGCRDDDDDDPAAAVNPGPGPGPGPDPDPEPEPEPEPEPDPEPEPEPPPGWVAQDGGNAIFTSISAINELQAWALSGAGIFRTQDGGSTWTNLGPLSPFFDREIQFFNSNQGWALSVEHAYVTSDGGDSWTPRLTTPANSELTAMSFISPTVGWVVSFDNVVHRTTDGGLTWTPLALPAGTPMSMKFVDSDTGWIAITASPTYASTLLKTSDGGTTWQEVWSESEFGPYFFDIGAVGSTHAWVVGNNTILATTDGGATWNSVMLLTEIGIVATHFVNPNLGWIIGDKIHRSDDGGATWTVQVNPANTLIDVIFVNETTGWVVGDGILKTVTGGQE